MEKLSEEEVREYKKLLGEMNKMGTRSCMVPIERLNDFIATIEAQREEIEGLNKACFRQYDQKDDYIQRCLKAQASLDELMGKVGGMFKRKRLVCSQIIFTQEDIKDLKRTADKIQEGE